MVPRDHNPARQTGPRRRPEKNSQKQEKQSKPVTAVKKTVNGPSWPQPALAKGLSDETFWATDQNPYCGWEAIHELVRRFLVERKGMPQGVCHLGRGPGRRAIPQGASG